MSFTPLYWPKKLKKLIFIKRRYSPEEITYIIDELITRADFMSFLALRFREDESRFEHFGKQEFIKELNSLPFYAYYAY
jgi:hypothetical protein